MIRGLMSVEQADDQERKAMRPSSGFERAGARLAGRLALVTGGASGIGLGIAEAFARAGMRVVIADRSGDRIAAALETLKSKASRVHSIEMDVADRRSVALAAEDVANRFGDLHVLCNSAGVNQIGPIDESV